jgi:chromosome segregation ATPase
MDWLNNQKLREDVSAVVRKKASEMVPATDKSRVKPRPGKTKGLAKKGKVIRFAIETRDDRGWNNRSTASSDRSSSLESGAASESFRRALSEIDELIVRDEKRSVEKNSARSQFELEESREMNRVLAEQLQLLHKTFTQQKKDGTQNVLEKKYITMKNKLSSVTMANQALLTKNEELQSRLRSGAGQTKTSVETEDREGLHAIIASLTTKVEEQKQEKMSFLAVQARTEAKATAQKNSIDFASTQISDLNARNTALEIETVSLKDELQDSKEAMENEAKEKEKLTKQISELFEDLDDMTETSKGLMARNEKLVVQICDFSEEGSRSCQQEQSHQQESQKSFMADIRARKLALQNKVANLNSKLGDAMSQAREREGIEEKMEEMERRMETRASTHQGEMVVVSTEMSELKARKSALELEIAGLKVRLENAHKEINVTRKGNASLIEEARRTVEIESKKKQEESTQPKAASHLDQHIGQLERNIKVLEDEKAALQTKYESCCNEFDFVNNSNRVLATKNRELQTQNRTFQKEANQCREEMEAKRAIVAALASKVEDLQVQRMALIGDKASVETQVTVERNSMVMASTQIAELDARNAALELEISELNDKLDSNENQKESDARKDDVDKKAMQAMIEVLQNERKALSEDRNRIEAEVSVHKNSWQIASQQNAELSARNAGLETEIDDLKNQNAVLVHDNSEMRIVYESKSRTNEEWTELQTQHDECRSKLDLAQETNKESAKTNKEMESQVCMQVNLINQLNHESQCKIRNLENFNHELKNKSLNLQEQHDRMESTQTELQAKYELSRSDVSSLTRRNKCLGREVEQQDSQFQTLSKEIVTNGMKGNSSAMTSIISALNRKVEHLQEEKHRLFETQASIEAQSTVHRNSMVVATTQIAELCAKKGALETEISELKAKLDDASNEIQTAHESMSVTQSTLNSINQLNEERQTKLDDLMHENDEMAQKNETLTHEQSELYASHTELVKKYESCSTELDSLQSQFQTQQSVQRSSMAISSTQISELSAINAALEIDIANLNDQLQTANQEIRATREAMSASVSVYTDKLDVLNQLNKACQSKIDEWENSKAALVQESASSKELRATLEDCKGQLVDQTYSNGVYKGLISQLNEMNDDLKTQYKAKKKEIESLREQKTDLTEQTKESARMKDELETLLKQKNEVDQSLANLKKTSSEVMKDRDVARREESYLSLRVDDLVKTEDKLEKTLKDWKRVSKGKMRQLNFMNTNLEKSNQEKTKEIERLRVRIMRRR